MKLELTILFFIFILQINAIEKRQLEFHLLPHQSLPQPQQQSSFYPNNQQHNPIPTVKLFPQTYHKSLPQIHGLPIHRYDYIDPDAALNSGTDESNNLISEVNYYKEDDLYTDNQPPSTYNEVSSLLMFSLWTEWSFCSRSCGGGVSMRSRECSADPSSERCSENDLFQYMVCNIEPCPNADEDYRVIQCAEFNNTTKYGRIFEKYSWEPYTGNLPSTCELRCKAIESSFWKSFGPAKDGTRCSQDRYDICVGGKCMPVGCDRILGSNTTEDNCRVCGGDNSSCKLVRRVFEESSKLVRSDYNEIQWIPKGATNIRVSENSGNFLALMEANGEFVNYVINGNWVINWPGDISAAGTMVRYERNENFESFFAFGPTKTDLYIMMLYLGGQPRIEIEYWLSHLYEENQYRRRFQIVPNKENFKTMPFIEPYSTTTDAPVTIPTTITEDSYIPSTSSSVDPSTTSSNLVTSSLLQQILSQSSNTPSTPKKTSKTRDKPLYCTPCKKTANKRSHFCDSDFVVHIQILSKKRMEGKRYRHDVLVRKVYKSSFKLMLREYLWVYSSCCPKLRPRRQYLVMGRKRRIKFSPGQRGSWITSDRTVTPDVQYQTRLVLDYLDYWRVWRPRYGQKMTSLSKDERCERNSSRERYNRDPEERSTNLKEH